MLDKLGLGIILDANDKMSNKTDRATRSMRGLKGEATRAGDTVVHQTDRMTAALSRYARGFTVGLKLLGLGAGLIAPSVLLARTAAESERTFSEVRSLLVSVKGLTEDMADRSMEKLIAKADEVASRYGILGREIEAATYPLVSAVGIEPAVSAMDQIAQMALAGKGTILQAVDLITSAYLTMGKRMDPALSKQEKFQRIVDQTAGSIQRYKTDLTALGAALTYSLGVSSVIGYDMADLGALTGALQSAGLKGTSAGTAVGAFVRGLAQTFRRLKEAGEAANLTMADFIKKAEGGTVASDKMSKMLKDNPLSQISFTDAAGNIRPFAKILQDIEKQFGIVTPEDIVSLEQYSQLLGLLQDEGSRAVLFLLGMGQELEEVTKQIRAGKSATKASDIVNAVFWNRTIMITNRLRVLAKSIGNVLLPSLHDLLDIVTIVTKKLLDFVKLHPDFTKWAVFGSVALGAMLLVAGGITLTTFTIKTAIESFAIILKQISWVTALVSKLGNTLPILYVRLQLLALWTKVAAAATWLWNAALAVNPIILIVAAIIAVVAAIVLLVKHWDWVADKFNMVWTGLREKLAMVPDWILIAFPILLIIKHWDKLWITIRYILDRIGSWLKMFWGKLRKLVGDMPTWFIAIFAPLLLIIKYWDEISNAIGNVSGVVANVATVVWDWLSTTAGKVANVFVSVWNTIKESAITVWNTISNAIVTVLDAIVNSIPFKAISKVFDWVVSGGRSALQFLGFGESFTGIPNQLPGPPALAGAGLAQPTPMLPSHTATTDYSIHRSQINIYPLPSHSPADIAEEINKELKPEGNF